LAAASLVYCFWVFPGPFSERLRAARTIILSGTFLVVFITASVVFPVITWLRFTVPRRAAKAELGRKEETFNKEFGQQ
jgi:hypothetical protein